MGTLIYFNKTSIINFEQMVMSLEKTEKCKSINQESVLANSKNEKWTNFIKASTCIRTSKYLKHIN